jgi:transmembrane sensor
VSDSRTEQAALWATRLAEGPLSERDEADLQGWLDADPANGAEMEAVVGAWASVDRYAAAPELMAMREAVLVTARRAHTRRTGWTLVRPLLPRAAMAAGLALAIAGAGFAWWLTPRTISTGQGERQVVALSDGSKISLDAATVVKVRYTGDRRRLWLERGRAKFDVAKDPLRPFSVASGGKVVVATGTAFSVELLQKQVRVVLYEGHVAVLDRSETGGPDNLLAEHELRPGRELITAVDGAPTAPTVVSAADPVRTLSWEGGQLVFEDEPLSSVVERLNRYSDTPLKIGDAAVGRTRVSGVFRVGDTNAFLQGVTATFGVQVDRGPDAIELRSKTG